MKVLGHRGYSAKAPENTMSAFELALEVGCDGIELDVHLTKDGQIVIIHDHTLSRTTNGTGDVAQHTLDELQKLDAGSWFSSEFKNEKIPTFQQLCELIKKEDILLNIELKSTLGFENLNEELASFLNEYNLKDRTIISSFNHYALVHFKRVMPEVKTGVLHMAALVNPWIYAKSIGADAIHPYYPVVVPEVVAASKQNGFMITAWTVDRPEDIERMKLAEVDGIITNELEKVQNLL
ncbi:MAG TPA: glycerophosphodiester phosphodiesterase [Natronincola sp.]|nr:glycerophosphodiester phosphodiesterase [Natronincola sp.]